MRFRARHPRSKKALSGSSGTQPDPLQALFLVISWQVTFVTCAGDLRRAARVNEGCSAMMRDVWER